MLIYDPVYPLHCWIDAPLVSACPKQPVDSVGKFRCARCPTRLSNCKGKLHKHETGKICQQCYDELRRSSSVDSPTNLLASVKPARSHKRALSDPGKSMPAPAP